MLGVSIYGPKLAAGAIACAAVGQANCVVVHGTVLTHASVVVVDSNATRLTSLKLGDSADLPSSENLTEQILLVTEERHLVKIIDDNDVASVEIGWPPEIARVVSIRHDVTLVGTIVHTFRQRVGGANHQSIFKMAVPSQLQRVIKRAGHVVSLTDGIVAFIRTQGVDVDAGVSRNHGRGRLIDVGLALQMQSATAYVRSTDKRLPRQLSLNCEIPAPGLRILKGFA